MERKEELNNLMGLGGGHLLKDEIKSLIDYLKYSMKQTE